MNIIKKYKEHRESIFLKDLGCTRIGLYGNNIGMYHSMFKRKQLGTLSFIKNEKIELFDKNERGGIITLSTDVNISIGNQSDINHKIMNWFTHGYQTIMNRFYKNKKVFNYLKSLDLMKNKGFTVGNLLKGSYISENGETFDESSFTVTINGINNDTLNVIGKGLSVLFNQESVLIHRYTDGETYLLFSDKSKLRNEKIDDIID